MLKFNIFSIFFAFYFVYIIFLYYLCIVKFDGHLGIRVGGKQISNQ